MSDSGLRIVASVIVSFGFAQAAFGQVARQESAATKGDRPPALFAGGVMVGKTLYISGKGDYRPDAAFPEKVKNCLGEIRKSLQSAGLDLRNVVKSFVYLEDPDKYAEMNKYYGEFFEGAYPARTTLGVAQVPGPSRLEITCIAYSDLSERKVIGKPRPGFPYSPGILAGDTLYVSGKGDQLPDGTHPSTFEEQVRQCMRNVEATLKEAGLDFRHVVMSHVFLDKRENLEAADRVYREFFEEGAEPACATVFVDWIPGGSHVEVTCIATTDLSARKVVRPTGLRSGPSFGSVTASPGVWAKDTLYVSELPGITFEEGASAGKLADQVHQLARNHTTVLESAGLRIDDLVSGSVYLRDMKDYDAMNAVYRPHFSRSGAVRTCLMPGAGIATDGILVEASFIAARNRRDRPK
ncbi:MAG: RidA family protein [Isosphaeraceae bacterium]